VQFLHVLLYILLAISSFFLICLVLIQRGKGGGLAGAFGGAGGSSAFGTKAGDVFTRVTMISAGIWIALNMLLVVLSNRRTSAYGPPDAPAAKATYTPNKTGDGKTGDGGKAVAPFEIPAKGPLSPAPKGKSTGEPAVPISGGSPSAPLPLPLPVTPTPTPRP
jgi:preprotein translocase subunit SecG